MTNYLLWVIMRLVYNIYYYTLPGCSLVQLPRKMLEKVSQALLAFQKRLLKQLKQIHIVITTTIYINLLQRILWYTTLKILAAFIFSSCSLLDLLNMTEVMWYKSWKTDTSLLVPWLNCTIKSPLWWRTVWDNQVWHNVMITFVQM